MNADILWFNDKGIRVRTDQILVDTIDLEQGAAQRRYRPFCEACMGMGANDWQRRHGKVCPACQGEGNLAEVTEPVFTETGLARHRDTLMRLAAEAAAHEAQIEAERQERERPAWQAWCDAHADLIAAVRRENAARTFEENLIRFLKRVDSVRIPTDRQVEGVTRSLAYFARRAEWDAQRAARQADSPAPSSRSKGKTSSGRRRRPRWVGKRRA